MYTEEEGGGIQADVQELAPIWTFLEGTLKGEGERERERLESRCLHQLYPAMCRN